jgi:hypothetical protein
MLRWAASFVIKRLMVLAVLVFAFRTYGTSSCQVCFSLVEHVSQILPALKEITRALQ